MDWTYLAQINKQHDQADIRFESPREEKSWLSKINVDSQRSKKHKLPECHGPNFGEWPKT